jgi:triacylglycerol lipase
MKTLIIATMLGLGAAALVVADARAESQEMAQVHAKVRAIGKQWNRDVLEKTQPLYVPLLAKASKKGVAVKKDLAYGPDPANKLDVYAPTAKGSGRPIVVFIHGGGLSGGDKNSDGTDGQIYANIPTYFARHGMVGVNVNYRLTPGGAKYPSGAEDLAGIVTWLRQNAAAYGGDAGRLYMIGNSAGGTHLATYLYNASVQPGGDPGLAGAILLSGAVGIDAGGPREAVTKAYYGDDKSKWAERAPVNLVDTYQGKKVPTFIITAEFDPGEIETPGIELYAKLCKRDNGCPRALQLRGHNHLSTALSFNTEDDVLGSNIRDFIAMTSNGTKVAKLAN